MAQVPKTKTTNKVLFDTVQDLRKLSNKTGVKVWKAVAVKLAGPASQRSQVNVGKIDKLVKDSETIIVCGKILGDGLLSKKVTVVALSASDSAVAKIEKAGGKFVKIKDHIAKTPDNKLRIIA
ncbi:MAG: 50S ribosomal protein L18e [Candidatus Woesearchaeota archaeon]|nr:50S ribosomal protein L18e [Candidatus Woesearchaeota archaeon]